MKKLGILCHVTSLISKFGVGDFGESSFNFINFLRDNNIQFWQILPLNNVNSYNCPYGSLSTETIDEMFVDLNDLICKGLLTQKDVSKLIKNSNTPKVNYKFVERRPGDLPEYYADPSKAYNELGWKTEKTLEDICRDSWNYEKNNM